MYANKFQYKIAIQNIFTEPRNYLPYTIKLTILYQGNNLEARDETKHTWKQPRIQRLPSHLQR